MTVQDPVAARPDARQEIDAGERFAFGENWRDFLATIDEDTVKESAAALAEMLECDDLAGLTFLDAGSGSGLSSLAARRMGARVTSFDFDPASVAATSELKRRFLPDDPMWTVRSGSVLDRAFLDTLGQFDVVYSWGVLHHTGAMYEAMDNVSRLVAPSGRLFISIYNDQGTRSRMWMRIKERYNSGGPVTKMVLLQGVAATFAMYRFAWKWFYRRPWRKRPARAEEPTTASHTRGMSAKHDLVDWVGGWPFEVARPDQVFRFYRDRGFTLQTLRTAAGPACNQFVFVKTG